jgi:hypothetical protein
MIQPSFPSESLKEFFDQFIFLFLNKFSSPALHASLQKLQDPVKGW